MAARRYYAYYIRGGQLALIEHDNISGSGQTLGQPSLDDIGPSGSLSWKSPVATVSDGLEIEYAYSPRYSISSVATPQVNKFYINGWTVIGGYLTFLRSHSASVPSWQAAPYSTVTSGTEGDTGGQTRDYIVISGSERWNGLHRVQTAGADGTLKTYTKVHESLPTVVGSSSIDITAEEDTSDPVDGIADRSRIAANNSSNIWLNNIFSTGDYIFVSGSEQAVNNGFWKISDVQADASNEIDSGIYITNRYYCYNAANTLSTEGEDTIPDTYATYDESVTIYKAYRDFCFIQTDINVLEDESDTIDLPEYLAKGLVYYVKAKMAEDIGEIEQKEYNMKEFRRILEKHESSKIRGPRVMIPGSHGIR